jgi:hypothetical protein
MATATVYFSQVCESDYFPDLIYLPFDWKEIMKPLTTADRIDIALMDMNSNKSRERDKHTRLKS